MSSQQTDDAAEGFLALLFAAIACYLMHDFLAPINGFFDKTLMVITLIVGLAVGAHLMRFVIGIVTLWLMIDLGSDLLDLLWS